MLMQECNYMNQSTEIPLFRIPCIWQAFRALHKTSFYLCDLQLNKGFTHREIIPFDLYSLGRQASEFPLHK